MRIEDQVWVKARFVDNTNEAKGYRKDDCGAWIHRDAYGNRNSQYGWEIDHIKPKALGGSDHISNLRPLQWQNNAAKGAGRTVCVVTAYGSSNG